MSVQDISEMLLVEVGKAFVFKSIRPRLRFHFSRAGFTEVPYALFGALFWMTVFATAVIYIVRLYPWISYLQLNVLQSFFAVFVSWVVVQGIIIAVAIAAIYEVVDFRIASRTASMEESMQSYLQFVSENLKGGMSFEKALWAAVRPQFGVLAEEMRLAAKKVMTGTDVEVALREFTDKYPSLLLKRSFDLIVEGTKGGGEVAETIDRVVENLEEIKELKGEIRATNLTYVMFIGIIVAVVAPLLFSLSYQFLTVLSGFASRLSQAQAGVSGGIAAPFSLGKGGIDVNAFRLFSMGALAVIGVFSSFIISIIQQGNMRGGIKYMPFLVGVSQVLYFVFLTVGSSIFGGIFH